MTKIDISFEYMLYIPPHNGGIAGFYFERGDEDSKPLSRKLAKEILISSVMKGMIFAVPEIMKYGVVRIIIFTKEDIEKRNLPIQEIL